MYDNISRIARLTPLLVGVDRCLVFLWDKSRSEFAVCEAQGLDKELEASCKTWRFKPGDWPLLDAVAQTRNYVAVEDTERNVLVPESLRRTFSIQAALAVPLVSKGELLGVLLVAYTEGPRRFTARRISIIEGIAYQTAIAIDNARLYDASLDQERTAQELRVAREIQISFLPASCPVRRGWEFAADWYAARGVGGGFYDFIPLGRDHLGLVIADVSDKGVPAAMFMSMSRTLVRASALTSRSPARTLERVNELIMTDPRSGMFVTLFYAILNWRTGQLVYCSAGHNPPVLWRHNESVAVPLTTKGIALGVIDDVKLEEQKTLMQPGDVLVLYTDGVTEPINDKEEEFGEERLVQTIATASGSSCHDIVQRVRTAVCDFVGEPPQFDDYTLVGVKRTAWGSQGF